LFVHRTWRHARVLLIGAILAPGRRTVASVLRMTGRSRERRFVNYHRVLSRAAWEPRAGARVLLGLLIGAFAPSGPVVMALDDTIERRRGKRITAKGIYRDPVRSSDAHFVKASGLRWMSLMLLAPIPWARRVWALPFLTALVPSERSSREQGHRHRSLLDVGRQLALQVRRWLQGRDLVLVGDSGFSALLFLDAMRRGGVATITRLRLDAALYDPAPPRLPGTVGRPRKKGARLPTLSQVLDDESTSWQALVVPGWYGAGERVIEIAASTAVWRHAGLPVVPIRWVLMRDPEHPSRPRLCSVPTLRGSRHGSWLGSCNAGRWRSPSRKPVRIWARDAAAMVGQGDRAHHALPAGAVLDRDLASGPAPCPRAPTHHGSRLVPQTPAHLQRRARRRAPDHLARAGFCNITAQTRPRETMPPSPSTLGLRPLPRRLNGQRYHAVGR